MIHCDFCRKDIDHVQVMIKGVTGSHICNDCTMKAANIVAEAVIKESKIIELKGDK